MRYNKLVRDKIPEIITREGKKAITSIVNQEEYSSKLKEKLQEEVQEFLESNKVEELADIMEVVYALAEHQNISSKELENLQQQKAEKRGSFKKRFILEGVKK